MERELAERIRIEKLENYLAHLAKGDPGTAPDPLVEGLRSEPQEPSNDQEPARARLGPFRLIELIGSGGQGDVWLAEDENLGRRVALKVLRSREADDTALLRFQREAEVMARLDDPGIATVLGFGRDGGRTWIALRLVEGESLVELVQRAAESLPGREDILATVEILEKVARTLHRAHEVGIVHRDIKPSNIKLTKAREPIILDFGLARDGHLENQKLTMDGAIFGTPGYMAPEQMEGRSADVNGQADVFSLGVVLYEVLTGSLPFVAPTLLMLQRKLRTSTPEPAHRKNPGISRDLSVVISTALEPDRSRRYRSASLFADDLERARRGEAVQARPIGTFGRLARWARRSPGLAASLALCFVSLASGLVVSLSFWNRAEDRTREILRLADARRIRHLLDQEKKLWPALPSLVEPLSDWLEDAREIQKNRPRHEASLRSLETHGQAELEPIAWQIDLVRELLQLSSQLETVMSQVSDRLHRAKTIRARSLEGASGVAWEECCSAIAASPRYQHLRLEPVIGLVPLRPDPDSGLWEFLHIESGAAPDLNPSNDRWRLSEKTGIILVLIPGGTFDMAMGATMLPGSAALPIEGTPEIPRGSPPPSIGTPGTVRVTLDSYFISKYEVTQAQWMRAHAGWNPSYHHPQSTAGSRNGVSLIYTLLNPVEQVSYEGCAEFTRRLDLEIPTEAQWEYAARGDTPGAFFTGPDVKDLSGSANIAGLEYEDDSFDRAPFHDGYARTSPVGSMQQNPFGLVDVIGNVFEWCRDRKIADHELPSASPRAGDGLRTTESPSDGRVVRGGSIHFGPRYSNNFNREFVPSGKPNYDIGLRPVRQLGIRSP